ncbi:uncharacterized protein TRIADDRAFT_26945 [Trichoplax adhaerens]|uniref:Transcription initiation factor TFIID subunit 10 n=1 Tax=Trichoplax adhaerens TaxID=10228 RepID=B3RZF0_TRIAD|nr:hypothetical protein TRIADDRAFT_26945 [Trichoplax adhaerens]EDV23833.1 hypothetical protein TRIADDRAFT_26945 [Trichoplax adhaerens]|eukprot:XP_002113359.1 hypothetical protein TRIADDRAFT_26945 [Trichoplax adhaerens]
MGENNAQIGGIRLAQFIQNIDDYTPTIPDDVTTYHLNRAGFDTTDPRVIRLISLTSQKFVSDIVGDAMQQCKMRSSSQNNKKGAKDKQYCLTMEDLAAAANEYGIHIKKPHYFS